MMKKLIANLVVITVIAFSILPFLTSFQYGKIVGPAIAITIITLFMIFWRISLFPKTGYAIFGYIIHRAILGSLLGGIIGWGIGVVMKGDMLTLFLLFWIGVGGIVGILLGYLKFRKKENV